MPKAMEMKHYKLFGDAFLRTLMAALGQEFTAEVRDAWTWFYSFVAKSMIFELEELNKQANAAPAAQEEMPALNRIATQALPSASNAAPAVQPVAAPAKEEQKSGFAINVINESGVKGPAAIPPVAKPVIAESTLSQEAKIKIIQDSWAIAAPKAHEVLTFFYDTLFEIDPEIKPLFADTDMTLQRIQVGEMITQAVGMLNNMNELIPTLASLGRRHIRYGVKEHHYAHFATAFMETLSQAFGVGFTHDMKASWNWLVNVITTVYF